MEDVERMEKKRMNQKGFTLIELLAVIVILAILMTLAVTSMQRYINNAKKDTYITTAQQFIDSVRLGILMVSMIPLILVNVPLYQLKILKQQQKQSKVLLEKLIMMQKVMF